VNWIDLLLLIVIGVSVLTGFAKTDCAGSRAIRNPGTQVRGAGRLGSLTIGTKRLSIQSDVWSDIGSFAR
jgi:hypothetical protein